MSTPVAGKNSECPRRVIRALVVALALLLLVPASLFGAWWLAQQNMRARWKGPALARLAELSRSNAEIVQELKQLKATPTADANFGWAQDHVILMTNGEYIVYLFRHGANSGFVDHLFLGHASDDRWFYSTYHFCNSMAGVLGDDPPRSIAEFCRRYSVREFDGASDECLRHTWP